MNNDGFIRKIDELGRVVIPKEVRKKLRIQDNENIIINYDNNKVYLSKYSYISNNIKYINELANYIKEIYKLEIIINDRESVIYNSAEYELSLENLNNINSVNINGKTYIIYEEDIISDSINVGKVYLLSDVKDNELSKLAKFVSKIISAYLQQT